MGATAPISINHLYALAEAIDQLTSVMTVLYVLLIDLQIWSLAWIQSDKTAKSY
jgi:hypothetical protein